MPSVHEIVEEAEKAVIRVINNNFKTETCPLKKAKQQFDKEKVVDTLNVRLLKRIGPQQVK